MIGDVAFIMVGLENFNLVQCLIHVLPSQGFGDVCLPCSRSEDVLIPQRFTTTACVFGLS